MPRRERILAAAALLITGVVATAGAAPSNVRLRVHDAAACDEDPCPSGSEVAEDDRFAGTLRMFVHAEDPFGMRRVRVEAHPPTAAKWYCIAEADVRDDGVSVDVAFAWDTRTWPAPEGGSGCTHTLPHIHGEPTPNGTIEMRAVAVDLVDDQQTAKSPVFTFALANPAAPPAWANDPSIAPNTRSVALAWVPGAEPDLVDYLISRHGPGGAVTTRRIDAVTPERDGCSRIGTSAIRCNDTLPAEGGTYSYRISARRPGGTTRCGPRAICVPGPQGEPRSVEIAAAGSGSPTPSPSLTVSPTATATTTEAPPATPTATPSIDGTLAADPVDEPASSNAPLFAALGLIVVGGVVIGTRLLRARTRPSA